MVSHPKHQWLRGIPDGIVHETAERGSRAVRVIEVKCPFRSDGLAVPAQTLYQVHY